MSYFTFEEQNLVCIYNGSGGGTRTGAIDALAVAGGDQDFVAIVLAGVIAALTEMQSYLEPDETELLELTNSALVKLGRMTDADFATLDLFPDFETEAPAYGE